MNMKKLILTNLQYVLFVYPFGKLAEAFRLAPGTGLSEKILSIGEGFRQAFASVLPAFHPIDLTVSVFGTGLIFFVMYVRGLEARKYRKGKEYGSARWSA